MSKARRLIIRVLVNDEEHKCIVQAAGAVRNGSGDVGVSLSSYLRDAGLERANGGDKRTRAK